MRILQLSETYPPYIGGTEGHTARLAGELARRGHHSVVATLVPLRSGSSTVGPSGERVHRIDSAWALRVPGAYRTDRPFHPPCGDPGVSRSLANVVRLERPDVVVGNNWMIDSYLSISTATGPPVVMVLHDYGLVCPARTLMRADGAPCAHTSLPNVFECSNATYGPARGPLIASALRYSQRHLHPRIDRFIAVSAAVAIACQDQIAGRPVDIVPTFVADDLAEVARTTARPDFLPDRDYLLFVGAMSRAKGLTTLYEAYEQLGEDRPALLVLGMPKPDTPRTTPAGVVTRHNVPHEQVMAAWAGCLFGVVPSISPESFGQVALEAMTVGRPVIVSRVGGLKDVVENERSGLVIDAADAAGLAQAMRRLLADDALRARLGEAAAVRARNFTVGSVAPAVEAVLEQALAASVVR